MPSLPHVVLILTAIAVLRPEKDLQLAGKQLRNDIPSRIQPAVERSLIRQKAKPIALQFFPVLFSKVIETCSDALHLLPMPP